ncbi:MAG: hypothetical protein ACI8UD_003647 [Planctomycetota bacterium]|jgi:hypothetical protein
MVEEQEDDWAPLTPEQLAQRPWDAEDKVIAASVGFAEVAPRPSPFVPIPERAQENPLSARQEKMLRELQERVAKAGPGNSLIAQAQRREQRGARKQKAAKLVAGLLAATCVVGEAAKEPEPEFEIAKQSDIDPREIEPWFQQLPELERDRLRAAWNIERHKFDHTGKAWRRRMQRAAAYGTLSFAVTGLLMSFLFMDLMVLVRCLIVGPIAGMIAQLIGGARFTYGLLGLLGFVVAIGSGIMLPFSWYGLMLTVATMAALGMDGEMRRSAGCEGE